MTISAIMYNHVINNCSIAKLSNHFKMDYSVVSRVMCEWKQKYRVEYQRRKILTKGSQKLLRTILIPLRLIWIVIDFKLVTVNMIHVNILSNSYLELIKKSSIKRILKEKLYLTYKKVNFVNQINIQRERIRRFYDSIQIWLSLINNEYEIIFFDEFSSNSRHNTIYNWRVKGEKSFVILNKEGCSFASDSHQRDYTE